MDSFEMLQKVKLSRVLLFLAFCVILWASVVAQSNINGSVQAGPSALDTTQVSFREDFCNAVVTGGALAATEGENNWRGDTSSGGTATIATSTFDNNHPCVLRLFVDNASSTWTVLYLGTNTIGAMLRPSAVTFDSRWIFKLEQTTATQLQIGLIVHQGGTYQGTGNKFVTLNYDTTLSDTNFMFTHNDGTGPIVRTSSGVAADTAWHNLRIRSTVAGTYLMSLDGGAETSFSTTIPATTDWASPNFMIQATSATSTFLDVDYFGITYSGLAR